MSLVNNMSGSSSSFVHLHCHTSYSLLDGAAPVDRMVEAAVRDNQPAIAVTDHGNCYGLIQHYTECTKAGIKPILGIEAYMAKNSIADRPQPRNKQEDDGGGTDNSGSKLYHHLTILAESNTGYQNLIKLSSDAFLKGYYRKPRVDWDILSEYSEGLIATSGCLGGVVLQHLLHDEYDQGLDAAARLQDIFGRDNFFIELQDHGLPEQTKTNPMLLEIAASLDAPLVACNDTHYVDHNDCKAQDALLCLQTGRQIADKDRFKFESDQHWIKTADEMRWLFREVEVACDNTLLIAERCDVNLDFGRNLLPHFTVPEGFSSEEQYLRALVEAGAKKRWGIIDEQHRNRLDYELDTIISMGFAGYFLIVWDLCSHARATGIRVGPARGSAGGCAVAYSLGITGVDQVRWELLFERFLNPARGLVDDVFEYDLKLTSLEVDNNFREVSYNGRDYSKNLGFV